MTERGAAPSDRVPACPFVAFDDDRDERADRPDHRHRCYAEVRPAPRALAHQESFCLSPRFPACPTFQDWARREAAQARGAAAGAPRAVPDARTGRVGGPDDGAAEPDAGDAADELAVGAAYDGGDSDESAATDSHPTDVPDPYDEVAPRSRQQRDWAAPPPWLGRAPDSDDAPGTDIAAAAGLAGPASVPGAGLATSRWLADVRPGDAGADDEASLIGAADATPGIVEPTPRPELAGLVGRQRRPVRPMPDRSRRERPVVGQARPIGRAERGRDPDDPTPAWERPRRFEAYPSIRNRVVLPSVPRVALAALAIVVAALLLLLLPGFFFSKNEPAAIVSPSPSASASASLAPTRSPAATPLTYTVQKNDTLIKIAQKFKVTQKAIQAANPSLKNANVITIGQVLIIPTPPPPDVIKSSTAPSPSPSKSAAP